SQQSEGSVVGSEAAGDFHGGEEQDVGDQRQAASVAIGQQTKNNRADGPHGQGVAHGGDDGALADVKLRGQRVVETNHEEEVESVERPAEKAGGNGVRRAARAMLSG